MTSTLVQSLNSTFFPPHIGAEPGRAKEESRITCMRMLRTNQSKIARRAFLKRPENFSGPKTFRGSFRVNFSGPGKRFSTCPKTPRILTLFRVRIRGELGSSRTLQIKPSFVDSFVESQANFWLFLLFAQFQHRLLHFD